MILEELLQVIGEDFYIQLDYDGELFLEYFAGYNPIEYYKSDLKSMVAYYDKMENTKRLPYIKFLIEPVLEFIEKTDYLDEDYFENHYDWIETDERDYYAINNFLSARVDLIKTVEDGDDEIKYGLKPGDIVIRIFNVSPESVLLNHILFHNERLHSYRSFCKSKGIEDYSDSDILRPIYETIIKDYMKIFNNSNKDLTDNDTKIVKNMLKNVNVDRRKECWTDFLDDIEYEYLFSCIDLEEDDEDL